MPNDAPGEPAAAVTTTAASPVHMLAELPTVLESVTLARHFVRGHLEDGQVDATTTDAVELLTSEIVTNAVKYGRPPVCVMVELRPRLVHVSVSDTSPVLPQRRQPGPDAVGGGGLWIIEATARRWGVAPAEGGKTVWFDLELGP